MSYSNQNQIGTSSTYFYMYFTAITSLAAGFVGAFGMGWFQNGTPTTPILGVPIPENCEVVEIGAYLQSQGTASNRRAFYVCVGNMSAGTTSIQTSFPATFNGTSNFASAAVSGVSLTKGTHSVFAYTDVAGSGAGGSSSCYIKFRRA